MGGAGDEVRVSEEAEPSRPIGLYPMVGRTTIEGSADQAAGRGGPTIGRWGTPVQRPGFVRFGVVAENSGKAAGRCSSRHRHHVGTGLFSALTKVRPCLHEVAALLDDVSTG